MATKTLRSCACQHNAHPGFACDAWWIAEGTGDVEVRCGCPSYQPQQITPLDVLEPYVGALLAALEDARAYRLGDASGLNDPDLDTDDRQHLLRYEDLERTLVAVVDQCTRCGHRHLVECDGLRPDPDPEGDHALLHCGCPEPEGEPEPVTTITDPWSTMDPDAEPPF